MTNDPEESAYLRDVQIQYLEGYDSDSFHTTDPICIISSDLSHKIAADGTVYLYTPWGEQKSLVVGTYLSEAEAVFVPWPFGGGIITQNGALSDFTSFAQKSFLSQNSWILVSISRGLIFLPSSIFIFIHPVIFDNTC